MMGQGRNENWVGKPFLVTIILGKSAFGRVTFSCHVQQESHGLGETFAVRDDVGVCMPVLLKANVLFAPVVPLDRVRLPFWSGGREKARQFILLL